MAEHNLKVNEGAEAVDNPNEPVLVRMTKVKVTAEDGIFKNGKLYKQGSEAIISRQAAENFEKVGEAEIIEDVDSESSNQ